MLINPWDFHPPYVAAMCPGCKTVHTAVPLAVVLRDCTSRDNLAPYYRCRTCGLATARFVHVLPGDAAPDCTLPPVVVGAAPDVPKADGEQRTLYLETAPSNGQELLDLIELYVTRGPAFQPISFRVYGVDADDGVIRAVLSASDPLAAAKTLVARYLDLFE